MFRRALSSHFGLFIFLWFVCGLASSAHAQSGSSTVPQGGSATFTATGTDLPTSPSVWEILYNGTLIASSDSSNGWTSSLVSGQFTISAPTTAVLSADNNYEVRTRAPLTGHNAKTSSLFDVGTSNGDPWLSTLILTPTSVIGGQTGIGKVRLSSPAPVGGSDITLSSSNSSIATVPASVTVPQGWSSTTFVISTTTVTMNTTATISASLDANTLMATVTVTPSPQGVYLSSLTVNPLRVVGSNTCTGTVTLNTTSSSNISVTLASDESAARVPAHVTIPHGQTSATFTVTSVAVSAPVPAVLSGTAGGQTQAAVLTLLPSGNLDVPAPMWAEDVIPTDQVPAGDAGPSSADSVNLASGVEENRPGPDLMVYNPLGPDAAYSRMYRSAQASVGYGSPGLSIGWVNNYDMRVQAQQPGQWGALTLSYPNGATETLIPQLNGQGAPNGTIASPSGAPYLVNGTPNLNTGHTGEWTSLVVTFKDHSTWTFLPDPNNANSYRLRQIANLIGRYIAINYDASNGYRLSSITDDAPQPHTLLSCSYSGAYLASLSDIYSRQVNFSFGSAAGATCLLSVSQVNTSNAMAWQYDYTAINGQPYLTSVSVPDPTGSGTMRGHTIAYDPATGRVNAMPDANGNLRVYTYNGVNTSVNVRNPVGGTVETWTQTFDGADRDTGTVDADNNSTSVLFADANNPYGPTRAANELQQPSTIVYDPPKAVGNVETTTDPHSLVTQFGYDYSPFGLGELSSVQEGSKTSTLYTYYTTSPYTGLIHYVDTPTPGSPSGSNQRVRTTYTYTQLGNVQTITSPAPNNNSGSTVTTTYNYTSDTLGNYSQSEALGEPLTVTDPLNHVTHYRYDARGNILKVIDDQLHVSNAV